jgi:hypothetical protein
MSIKFGLLLRFGRIIGLCQTSAGERKFPDHPESAQEIRFFGKIGFLKPSDFSNRAQGTHQEIRFLGKIGFLKPSDFLIP